MASFYQFGGTHRHGTFIYNHFVFGEDLSQFIGHTQDVLEIRAAVFTGWRAGQA